MVDAELESVFGDLCEELELQSVAPPAPPAAFDAAFVQQATAALEGVVAASPLLSGSDRFSNVTRPYEVPVEELLRLRDDVSAQHTVPVSFDDLPDEAWPTELHALPV
jgi:hypothetical protein